MCSATECGHISSSGKGLVANFADAVVTHNGVQPVLAECGPPNNNNQNRRYLYHYKLAHDLKDTWAHCIDTLIKSKKDPPTNLKVAGIQSFQPRSPAALLRLCWMFSTLELTSFSISRHEYNGFAETFMNQ